MPGLSPALSRRHLLSIAGALGLAWLAPSLQAAPAGARQRLVCIGGALTEMLYALGVADQLVGVDSTSRYPAAATRLPNVGYARTLAAEGILALAPTQVLASEDAGPPAVLAQLRAAGVAVHILPANHRFEGVMARLSALATLTGQQAAARPLAERLQADWRRVMARVAAQRQPGPRVLFLLQTAPGQMQVAGSGTAAEAMLQYAGARNALQGFHGYRPLNAEALLAAQPDVLLLSTDGLAAAGGTPGVLALPGVAQTPAGRQQRILAQDALLLLGFGPRLPQAVDQLVTALAGGRSQ